MALLFTILSENFSSVFSATTFGGTNFAFSMLTDHGEEQRKKLDLVLEKLQRARHASGMLMKQCLNTIEYLQNR